MRPLIVLVLVLLAAAGVVLGLLMFGDEGGPQGGQAVAPGAVAPVASFCSLTQFFSTPW